jgi:acyl-CoA synthetase (AMP-forming)/AMP-acid ligase II
MKPIDENTYELVLLKGLKAKIFSNSDTPPESFHSRDLFEPHSTIPNAWKYVGRLDDRVTLVNGEKVLPLPIEGLIRESPLVKEAVVFGIGRAVPGILIFRNHGSDMSDDEFLDSIWPVVEKANKRAEGFSQIGKDMVIVVNAERPYPMTDKGSVIRAQTYKVFSGLIDDVYQRRDNVEEGDLALEIPETANLILAFCKSTLELSVDSIHSDLFASGLDSLKAIQLSVFIRKTFNLGGKGPSISQNIIYDHGSVNRVAELVYHSRMGASLEAIDDTSTINAWVEKYSQFENPICPAVNLPKYSRHRVVSETVAYFSLFLY